MVAMSGRNATGIEPFQLNRQVTDAQARIELVRADDGARGQTSMQRRQVPQYSRSGGSAVNSRFVSISAEENPIAKSPADEIGVLANKPNARALREVALEAWGRCRHIQGSACPVHLFRR